MFSKSLPSPSFQGSSLLPVAYSSCASTLYSTVEPNAPYNKRNKHCASPGQAQVQSHATTFIHDHPCHVSHVCTSNLGSLLGTQWEVGPSADCRPFGGEGVPLPSGRPGPPGRRLEAESQEPDPHLPILNIVGPAWPGSPLALALVFRCVVDAPFAVCSRMGLKLPGVKGP